MQRRPDSSRRLLPPYALQCVADLLGGERRELRVRYRHQPLAPLPQLHGSGSDLDLQPAVASADLERLAGPQSQSLPQRLGHDDPTGTIDDSFHGTYSATKMALPQPRGASRISWLGRGPPAVERDHGHQLVVAHLGE